MDTITILNRQEMAAVGPREFITSRMPARLKLSGGKGGTKAVLAVVLIAIFPFVGLFLAATFIPTMILANLVDLGDQAYNSEVKVLVLQEALAQGEMPSNTARRLSENGTPVGYIENGEFIELSYDSGDVASNGVFYEGNTGRELVIKVDDSIISADNFYTAANQNPKIWNSIQKSTYGNGLLLLDDSAMEYYRRVGIDTTNYDKSFEELMSEAVTEGNDVSIYGQSTQCEDNSGQNCTSSWSDSSLGVSNELISNMNSKNKSNNIDDGTLNTADSLATASTAVSSKSARKLAAKAMGIISRMKAGDEGISLTTASITTSDKLATSSIGAISGSNNGSLVTDLMNWMFEETSSEVTNIETGEAEIVKGSMLEAPSLYAMLTKSSATQSEIQNFRSDRILKTVENSLDKEVSADTINTSVVSVSSNSTKMARAWLGGTQSGSLEVLQSVEPAVRSALINNSFENINGIAGGEFLASGLYDIFSGVSRYSGSTKGDLAAATEYARLSSAVAKLDSEADRISRSPFDITSKNTFLGSIVYKLGVSTLKSGSMLNKMTAVATVTTNAVKSLFTSSYADDGGTDGSLTYYTGYGVNCDRYDSIGAVATAGCYDIEVFDTSTLGNRALSNPNFVSVVESNTRMENGVRRINDDSVISDFLVNNTEREAPAGVVDANVLSNLNGNSSFVETVVDFVANVLGVTTASSETKMRKATGKEYVNSASNPSWGEEYKYTQLYLAANRVVSMLRKYDGDPTAFSNLKLFEGVENPVLAYLEEYHKTVVARD
ncbi:MAG: hypothetical protein Q4A79_00125 [Candidatus Saccharibacteria bacterium]|nr:hypothetical protein [Candidatus Saccharibacteria bacterium]